MSGVPGVDIPDARGRTGLDRTGRYLTGNPDVVVTDVELLAAAWHVLRRTTIERRRSDGTWTTEQRETYDRGNGATLLPYDVERGTVLLTRQFRYPVYSTATPTGCCSRRRPASSTTTTPRRRCAARPRRAGGGLEEEGEDIELPFDEALDMIDDGRIADARTILLLQWAALRGPFRTGRGPSPA